MRKSLILMMVDLMWSHPSGMLFVEQAYQLAKDTYVDGVKADLYESVKAG